MAWTVEDKLSEIESEIENIELTPGPDGLTAYQVAVSEGFEGTQNEWINSLVGEVGPSGKTPYELALEEGFKGTQEDWLNSLIGKDGEDAITYLLDLETFYLRKDREEGTITPSEFSVKGLKSIGGSAPSVLKGYFVVYAQPEAYIAIDNYTDMDYKSLVELEKECMISGVDFPYVKKYQSTSPESEIVLTPSTNILKVHIEWYEDEGLSILRDVEQIPVISDGLDTYRVEINSLNGDTFKNGIIDTWVYATVDKGDKDVTSEIEER